jgi:hypothetical protein
MSARRVLIDYLVHKGRRSSDDQSAELYPDNWFRYPIFGFEVPLLPLTERSKRNVCCHDLHHILTGYGSGKRDEWAIAGWELASGGCGPDPVLWLDRSLMMLAGLARSPRTTLRAIKRGRSCRNLYISDLDTVLELSFDELARQVIGPERDSPGAPAAPVDAQACYAV